MNCRGGGSGGGGSGSHAHDHAMICSIQSIRMFDQIPHLFFSDLGDDVRPVGCEGRCPACCMHSVLWFSPHKGLIHYYTSHKGTLIHYIDLHKSHEPFFAYDRFGRNHGASSLFNGMLGSILTVKGGISSNLS